MPRRLSPRRTGHSKPRSQSLVSKRRSSFAACRVTHFLTFRAAGVEPLQHVARILHSIQMIRCAQAGRLVKAGAEARGRNPTKAAQTRRPKLVGLRCRSTRPTTLLPFHPTYDFAAAPTDLQPRAVGLRCRSTRPTTLLPLHRIYGHVLSGCAAAPPDLRPSCRPN